VKRGNRGFTLIELMISCALFGLIAAGAMSLVMSSARQQSRSSRVDVAQASARAGLDFITRDVLSASAGASSGALVIGSTGATQLPVVNASVNNVGTNGEDKLELWLADPSTQAVVLSAVQPATTSFTIDQNPGFTNGAWAMISDLSTGLLVKPSFSGTTVTLPSSNSFTTPTQYAAGSYLFKVRHVTYAVAAQYGLGTSAVGNGNVLTFDDGSGAQPLADGVEDMQIAYGFDNNADGLVTETGSTAGDDEWVYNVAGETMPATLANLRSIRITLIVKGTQPEQGVNNNRPKAEDHAAGSTFDAFIRRTVRTEISVRNFNL
jgi:prepilin-type N-terminal cleavage/methylation domain-containing protein